jgi:hypothetical protein
VIGGNALKIFLPDELGAWYQILRGWFIRL